MKITKRNPLPEDKVWKAVCRNCKSEAEATEREMTNIITDPRDGLSLSWEACPVCNAGPDGGMLFYPWKK